MDVPVMGGGKWGRVVAKKLVLLGYRPIIVTKYPKKIGEITRSDLSLTKRYPKAFVVSASADHFQDYQLLKKITEKLIVEKNLGLTSQTHETDIIYLNQFLYNELSIPSIKSIVSIKIQTTVEKKFTGMSEIFDWLCHELAIIANIIVSRGEALNCCSISVSYQHQILYLIIGLPKIQFSVRIGKEAIRQRLISVKYNDKQQSFTENLESILVYRGDPLLHAVEQVCTGRVEDLIARSRLYSELITNVSIQIKSLQYSEGN